MRVAVFGAGYAGLTLASELEDRLDDDVDLVVVDEDGTHLVQHELHRVVRRPGLADHISIDLSEVFDRASIREATVTDVDVEVGVATLAPSGDERDGVERLSYDFAGVCLGARTNYYDLPGVREHGTPLKRLGDARTIRAAFIEALEAADADDSATVVVGGAGLSGVQVAGELAALAAERGAAADVDVVLLEQADSVAPAFPDRFQRAVRDALEATGVTVRTGTAVRRADESAIGLATGETLAYDQFVWTGGIRGSPALDCERPVTRNTLRLGDGTFVLGDAASVVDTDGTAVPASAQTAVREARVAARNIERLLTHARDDAGGFEPRLEGYRYDALGWLVSVGDDAVAQVGPTVLTGRAAKLVKTSVGAGYLTSVGAVENAVDLVREEMGWPDADADDGDVEGAGRSDPEMKDGDGAETGSSESEADDGEGEGADE